MDRNRVFPFAVALSLLFTPVCHAQGASANLSVSGTTEQTEVTPGAFVLLNGPLVSATISYTRGVPRPDTLFLNEPLGTGNLPGSGLMPTNRPRSSYPSSGI